MHLAGRILAVISAVALVLTLTACESSSGGSGLNVGANDSDGIRYTAAAAGSYTFVLSSGAYSFWTPAREWFTRVLYYVNRPAAFGRVGGAVYPTGQNGTLGSNAPQASQGAAEAAGVGTSATITLGAGEFVTFIVPDSLDLYADNVGAVRLSVTQNP